MKINCKAIYLLVAFMFFSLVAPVFADSTVFKSVCGCCNKCKCVRSCKCGGKCNCCYRCNCADKCMCLGECKCCKKCKCEYQCTCQGKCRCCANCYCVMKRVCDKEAYPAGKRAYIIVGEVEMDGPNYIITTENGNSIEIVATGATEFYPYWIKPENLPKVIIKYSQQNGNMMVAEQICDAKFARLGKAPSGGKMVYYIIKKELPE